MSGPSDLNTASRTGPIGNSSEISSTLGSRSAWKCAMNDQAWPASAGSSRSSTACASIFPHRFDLRNHAGGVALACCKVGLDRPLIPTAFVAKLFRSARVSRSRRSADRGSPGDAPPVGDWETCVQRGRAGQEATAVNIFETARNRWENRETSRSDDCTMNSFGA